MKFLRRLAFLLGFLPMTAFALGQWVFTGTDPLKYLDRFIDWGSK